MPFFAFAIGAVFALAVTPLVRRLATRTGAVDRPNGERKRHEKITPLFGGLAVCVAVAAALFVVRSELLGGFILPKHLAGILIGGAILVIGGMLDDRFDLKPWQQLLCTSAAALCVIAAGVGADVITNPFGGVLRLDHWHLTIFEHAGAPYRLTLPADLFTFAWLMVMMYATKFLDGLDGLVSGLGVIGAVVIAVYSLTPGAGQPELAYMAAAVAGAFAGFLVYNGRPASIFLGEGGSTLTGFLLGTMAILAGAKIGTTLMVMAVPLIDLGWTVIRRLVDRRPLASGDTGHLHFRLMALGLTHRQTVWAFWTFAAAFGGAGLFLQGTRKLIFLAALVALFFMIILLIRLRHGQRD